MKYLYIIIAIVIIGLVAALNITRLSLREARMEAQRQENNNSVLQTDLITYKAKNGDLVAKTEALSLTVREMKKYNSELVLELKNQGIRVNDLQTALKTISSSQIIIKVPVHDTIIEKQPVRTFLYKDNWNTITGVIKDSVELHQESRDSILILNTKEPHRFLFFRWGVKYEVWTIKNSNPATKIQGFKVIELKK